MGRLPWLSEQMNTGGEYAPPDSFLTFRRKKCLHLAALSYGNIFTLTCSQTKKYLRCSYGQNAALFLTFEKVLSLMILSLIDTPSFAYAWHWWEISRRERFGWVVSKDHSFSWPDVYLLNICWSRTLSCPSDSKLRGRVNQATPVSFSFTLTCRVTIVLSLVESIYAYIMFGSQFCVLLHTTPTETVVQTTTVPTQWGLLFNTIQ